SGVATFSTATLAGGTHSVTAVYGGDSSFNGSTSQALSQVVNLIGTAITVMSNANPSQPGQPVTLTAKVSDASGATVQGGTVSFSVDGVSAGGPVNLDSSGQASLTTSLASGPHQVVARYSGSANFL